MLPIAEPIRLPGIPLTDPAWAQARRGRRPPNFGRTFPAEPLTAAEVVALLQRCDMRRPSGDRNRALIVLLWRTGLRIEEALDLHPKDVNLARGTVRVLAGKGQQDGISAIDPTAADILAGWLAKRIELGIAADKALFCTVLNDDSVHGELHRALGAAYVRNLLKRLARSAGVLKRVHPHGFRHTLTDELLEEGMALHVIQAQLRHRHLTSTEAYVRKIGAPELLREIRGRPWPREAHTLTA